MEVVMRIFLFPLLLAACVLAGCATTAPVDEPRHSRATASEFDPDPLYIAQVEAAARKRGVDVVWVNPRRVKDRRY
jgi:outer membrane PBP1 activator LpoA protein